MLWLWSLSGEISFAGEHGISGQCFSKKTFAIFSPITIAPLPKRETVRVDKFDSPTRKSLHHSQSKKTIQPLRRFNRRNGELFKIQDG